MKKRITGSTVLPILIYVIITGLQVFHANASSLSCSPNKINLHANYGMASICIMGDTVEQISEFALFKDEKLIKEVIVNRVAFSNRANDRVTILIHVTNFNITDGDYKLKGNLKSNKSVYITLPVEIKINKPVPIKKPQTKLAPYIQLGKYNPLDAYRALAANNKAATGFAFNPSQSVLNDPSVRRNMMLNALAEEIASSQPQIKDWFPKSVGAQGGTLVIAGENLELIGEVRIGQIVLKPISPTEYSTNLNAGKTRVFKLPDGNMQGSLYWKRAGSTVEIPIENNYKIVSDAGQEWPAIRTTYIGAANCYIREEESVNNTLNRGRGDAMRLIQFSFLIEYIPGNIINSVYFAADIPKLNVKMGEYLTPYTVYSFADASGNKGVFGNTMIIHFQKYVRDTEPSVNFEVRTLPCSIAVESYLNTASLSNNKFKRFGVLNLEYNALKKYTIDRTNVSEIKRLFAFQNTFAWGQVSGTSRNGDGSNAVDVGVVSADGDIAIRLASGPLGTKGIWLSPAMLLPHGWLVDGITWSEKREFSNSMIMAYSSATESNGLPGSTNDISMISLGLYTPLCGGTGTRYNPGTGKESQLTNNVPKTSEFKGKGLSFGVKNLEIDATHWNLCALKPETVGWELRDGQYVKGSTISLAADSYFDNSVRVLMKLESINFLGPHDGDFNNMLSKIYLYDSNSLEYLQYDGATLYPPSQLERYVGYPVDYYMFSE